MNSYILRTTGDEFGRYHYVEFSNTPSGDIWIQYPTDSGFRISLNDARNRWTELKKKGYYQEK